MSKGRDASGDQAAEGGERLRHVQGVLDLLSGGLLLGKASSSGALTLVPIFGGSSGPAYLVGSYAFETGLLSIAEVGNGSVSELVADNRADLPVLLLDGEHLEGAKQNRILNVTVLLAARHSTVIPVTCVEEGRWHYSGREDFSPAAHSYSRLRAVNAEAVAVSARKGAGRRTDQAQAWAEVRLRGMELGVAPSSTGALSDYYEGRVKDLEAMRHAFPAPEEGSNGVLACVGGKPVAADVFDRPETLAKPWPRLIAGYAADALGHPTVAPDIAAAERFLAQAGQGEVTSHEGIGLGLDVLLTAPSVVGSALTWEESAIHLAVFARAARDEASSGAPIARPSRRRNRLG